MYESLEIRIGKSGPVYPVTVSQSAAGDASGSLDLDFQSPSLQSMLTAAARHLTDENLLQKLGETLFSALFHGNIATAYRACLNSARARKHSLRLRLTIEPPELAALPWEFLFDPQERARLAISPETAVVRYIPIQVPASPVTIKLPLRVLVVSATPRNFPLIDAERGAELVRQALADLVRSERAQLEVIEHATDDDIALAMRRMRPHIFHFIGHGAFENNHGVVLLEDENGNAQEVSDHIFCELLTGCTETRLVVLSTCQSATVSRQQPLVGLAPRLLQRQVPAVVAMQYPILQKNAFVFARHFYSSLALGYPLETAVSEGRRAIYVKDSGNSDWANPVLFLRAEDGMLFLEESDSVAATKPGPAQTTIAGTQIGDVGSGAVIVTGSVTGVVANVISGTVISNVTGDVNISQAAPITLQPPPAPTPPPAPAGFIGREQELAAYAQLVHTTGYTVITGIPGLGKTALAAVLALRVAAPDKIFWHTFHTGEGLDSLLWGLAGFAAWHGKDSVWQYLQQAPQLRPPPAEALLSLLLPTLRGQGFLLCLDNIHYSADDPNLAAAIHRLAGALSAGDLRLIATADRMTGIDQFDQAPPLGGMSLADTRLLLDSRKVVLSIELSAALHAKTSGNVGLLSLAANALQQATDPQRLIDRLARVGDIGRYLLKEVDKGLRDAERRVMSALAVLGDIGGTLEAVEAVLDGDNPQRTLLTLSGRYLVSNRIDAIGTEYFIAPILQAFYYASLDRKERQAMHTRAGSYYQHEEYDALRAAQHFVEAGEMARAAHLAVFDVRGLINRGKGRALRNVLERFAARELLPLEWVKVKLAHGQVAHVLGERAVIQQVCEEALYTLDRQAATAEVRVLRSRACRGMVQALEFEDPQEALSWVERGLAELAALPPSSSGRDAPAGMEEAAALLQIHAASLQIALGDYNAALEAALAAVEALPEGAEALLAYNYRNLGTIYSYQSEFVQATRYNESSLAISRRLHDDLNVLAVLNNMGIDKEIAGDWTGAAANYQEALELANRLESVVDQTRIGNALAMLHIRSGDYEAAEQTLAHAVSLARGHAIDEGLMYLLHTQAELAISRQAWDAAEPALTEAEQLTGKLDAPYVLVEVLASQAQLALGRGEPEQALARVERAVELAEELELRLEKGKALRVLGQVQLALGDSAAALDAFAQSQELLEDEPYEAARTQAAWGAALHLIGEEQGAVLLKDAIQTFAGLGAQRDYAHTVALLGPST